MSNKHGDNTKYNLAEMARVARKNLYGALHVIEADSIEDAHLAQEWEQAQHSINEIEAMLGDNVLISDDDEDTVELEPVDW